MKYLSILIVFTCSQVFAQCIEENILIEGNPNSEHCIFADLDQDGDEDLLFTAQSRFEVYAYYNDGTGSFSQRDTIISYDNGAPFPMQSYAHDVDGDLDLDLIVIRQGTDDYLDFYENLGGLNFSLVNTVTIPSGTINYTYKMIEFADLNNDGIDDLICSVTAWGGWLQGTGGFNFINPQNVFYGGDLLIFDADGDTELDIVSGRANYVSVNLNPGNGAFLIGDVIDYTATSFNSSATEVYNLDYDSDNDQDVVMLSNGDGTIRVYINDGLGAFSTSILLYSVSNSYWLSLLRFEDLNNDTFPDLVFNKKDISNNNGDAEILYMEYGAGSFAPPVVLYAGSFGTGILEIGSADSDTIPELIIEGDSSTYIELVQVLHQDSVNQYSLMEEIDQFDQIWGTPSVWADLDNDNDIDIYCPPFVYHNDGNELYDGHLLDETAVIRDFELYDFSGDGYLDIVAVYNDTPDEIYWRLNDGTGLFGPRISLGSVGNVYHLELYDHDVDGDQDIIFTNVSGGDYYIGRISNLGAGTFGSFSNLWTAQYNTLNLNSIQDLEAPDSTTGITNDIRYAFTKNGNQSVYVQVFGSSSPIEISGLTNVRSIEIFDVDNDGFYDVLFSGASIGWNRNNGDGTFAPATILETGGTFPLMIAKDLDNDGYKDLTCLHEMNQEIFWMKNLGNSSFVRIDLPTEPFSGNIDLYVEDLYLDSFPEIIYNQNILIPHLRVIENNGGSLFAPNFSAVTQCNNYTWGQSGSTYTASGIYVDYDTTANGCDSVFILDLNINPTHNITTNDIGCDTYTWSHNNQTYSAGGFYSDTLSTLLGCDSIVSLSLTLSTNSYEEEIQTNCDQYTWNANGQTYYSSGIYYDSLNNSYGCDSILSLNLTISTSSYEDEIQTDCVQYTWSANGQTYYSSGMYYDSLINLNGCDSVRVLDLTITSISAFVVQMDDLTLESSPFNSYQWVDCDNNLAPIPGETNQELTATQNGTFAVIVSDGNCSDTSDCFVIDQVGIDDLERMDVTVFPNPFTETIVVSIKGDNGLFNIELLDLNGRVIYNKEHNATDNIIINSTNLSEGFYFLSVKGPQFHQRYKLTKIF